MRQGQTREKILDASLKIFSDEGYLGATTREIARKAGIAEVTLFRYFPSKAKLFEEVIRRYSFLPALKGLLPQVQDMHYRAALTEIARRFLDRLEERRELIRIMHAEIHRYPSAVRTIYQNFIGEIFATLASYFRDLQSRKLLRPFNPDLGARAFLGMFFSYFNAQDLLLRGRARSEDNEKVIQEFLDVFIRGTVK